MNVVIDTNVVVSGLLFKGVPGKIVALWQKRAITSYVSPDIVDEYIRVLSYPTFQLSRREIEYLIYREILPYFETVIPSSNRQIVSEDPADDMFIHCALTGPIEIIISGDKHLLDLETYESIPILHPADCLKRGGLPESGG